MRLIIENKIKLNNSIPYKDIEFLRSMNVYVTGSTFSYEFEVIEQKIDLSYELLEQVMQIIEWYSVDPLVIRWFPDSKFYMYTEEYYSKLFYSKKG